MREEFIDGLILDQITALATPPDVCDWVIHELERDREVSTVQLSEAQARMKAAIEQIDLRVHRLTEGYAEGVLSIEEYRTEKERFINQKLTQKEKLAQDQQQARNRFEPAVEWLKTLKLSQKMADPTTGKAQRLEYFKKVGSNPVLMNRELRYMPREAWQLVAGQGSFAHPFTAAVFAAAAKCGETHLAELKRRSWDDTQTFGFAESVAAFFKLHPDWR